MGLVNSSGPVRVVHVVQGTVGVTDDSSLAYSALIGASVVVCLCDPVAQLGGMAHFEFPGDGGDARFGAVALQALMQQIEARGGRLDRAEGKLFGGARMHEGGGDMGKRCADFALQTLRNSGFRVIETDLGNDAVRRVRYVPTSGKSTVATQVRGVPIAALAL